MLSYTKQDIKKHLDNNRTVVLYTSKDTILLNTKHTSENVLNEILNSGMFRHNQIINGRVL